MRTLPKIVAALISLTALCSTGVQAEWFTIPSPTGDEVAIRRAKLDQIAILVRTLSNASSNLMIEKGVGASPIFQIEKDKIDPPIPPVETIVPKPTGNIAPFLSVFSVSKPVKTNLKGIGEGKILGAVSAFYPVGANFGTPEGKNKAEAGVYMLFFPESSLTDLSLVKKNRILLVSLNVDNQGVINYKEAAGVDDDYSLPVRTDALPEPRVAVSFVSLLANIEMEWNEQKHKFSLDMETGLL